MDDTKSCPICGNKLRNSRRYKFSIDKFKFIDYFERSCTKYNHVLRMFSDEDTNQVDLIRITLSPSYSKLIEIDFLNQSTKISILKMSKIEYSVNLPRLIEPDFPNLTKLQDKIQFYMTYS